MHNRMYADRPASSTQYLRIFAELGIFEVWKMQVIKATETMWEGGTVGTHPHLLKVREVMMREVKVREVTMREVKVREVTMREVMVYHHRLVHQNLLAHLPDHLLSGSVVLLDIIRKGGGGHNLK
jgi:hypothetical protein